jgi:hypothetical protein
VADDPARAISPISTGLETANAARDVTSQHIARVYRQALAVASKLRLDLAHSRITDRSSNADIEYEAESAVKDLMALASSTYPSAQVELISVVARSLLVDSLSQRRRKISVTAYPTSTVRHVRSR